jgi:hypothetical protein
MLLTLCQPLNFPRMPVVSWLGVVALVVGRCKGPHKSIPTVLWPLPALLGCLEARVAEQVQQTL